MYALDDDTQDENPLLIGHHARCLDGEWCRWVIERTLGRRRKVKHIPIKQFNPEASEQKMLTAIFNGYETADIYVADASLRSSFMDRLVLETDISSVLTREHHITTQRLLGGYVAPRRQHGPQPFIDTKVELAPSNAVMLWHRLATGEPPPALAMMDHMDGSSMGLDTEEKRAIAAFIDHYFDSRPLKNAMQTLTELSRFTDEQMSDGGLPLLHEQDEKRRKLMSKVYYAKLQIAPDAEPVWIPLVKGNIRGFARPVSRDLVLLGQEHGAGIGGAIFQRKEEEHRSKVVTLNLRSDGTPDLDFVVDHWKKIMGIETGGGHADCAAIHFPSPEEFERHVHVVEEKPRIIPVSRRIVRPNRRLIH